MKRILFGSIAVVIALIALAGYSSAQGTATKFKKPAEPGTLSEEDIAALKQEYTDPKLKKSWKWTASFAKEALNTKDAQKAKLRKKIPYRITCALYQIKEIGGKQTSTRESGTCYFFLTDAEGNVVFKKSENLNKMCPS